MRGVKDYILAKIQRAKKTERPNTKTVFGLSTGRCATAFLAHVFDKLPRAKSDHEPNPDPWREVHNLANVWMTDYSLYKSLTPDTLISISEGNQYDRSSYGEKCEFKHLLEYVRRQASTGLDYHFICSNSNFSYAKLLRDQGFHLIHLVRNPITWVESELSKNPKGEGHRPREFYMLGKTPAEKAAYIWLYTNKLILEELRDYGRSIMIKMEDLDVQGISRLTDFVGARKIHNLQWIIDNRDRIKSKHYGGGRMISNKHNRGLRLSAEERQRFIQITGELAAVLGYSL